MPGLTSSHLGKALEQAALEYGSLCPLTHGSVIRVGPDPMPREEVMPGNGLQCMQGAVTSDSSLLPAVASWARLVQEKEDLLDKLEPQGAPEPDGATVCK